MRPLRTLAAVVAGGLLLGGCAVYADPYPYYPARVVIGAPAPVYHSGWYHRHHHRPWHHRHHHGHHRWHR